MGKVDELENMKSIAEDALRALSDIENVVNRLVNHLE